MINLNVWKDYKNAYSDVEIASRKYAEFLQLKMR